MHCHVNPFMMNNFWGGNCCCHNFYNYYNPFGATTRFMMNTALELNMMQQNLAMMPYQMPLFNNCYPQYPTYQMPAYQMPVFQSFQMPIMSQAPFSFSNNYKTNNSTQRTQTTQTTTITDTGKLDKNFLNKVKQVAQNLNCDYKDLLAVINGESGFKTDADNGIAVGIIQFTDVAIKELNQKYGLNLTKAKIKNMSAIQQLDLAEKLWKITKKTVFGEDARLAGEDLSALNFLPGRAKQEVLCSKGEKGNSFYESNAALDTNKDGKITKSELRARLNQKRVDESIFA